MAKLRNWATGQELNVPDSQAAQMLAKSPGFTQVATDPNNPSRYIEVPPGTQGTQTALGSASGGRPERPDYTDVIYSAGGPGEMGLQKAFRLDALPDVGYTEAGLNQDALKALRERALSTGMSPWEKMARETQGLEEGSLKDIVAKQSRTGAAQTFSDLATRGGIGTGARERLARGAGEQGALAQQDVARQGMLSRLGIGQAGEEQRLNLLQSLPGMETQASSYLQSEYGRKASQEDENRKYKTLVQQRNLDEALKQIRAQDQFKLDRYKEDMAGYGAEKTAQATSGGGGLTWICTAISEKEDFTRKQWATLSKMRRHACLNHVHIANWYFGQNGKKMVQEMLNKGVAFLDIKPRALEIISLAETNLEKAVIKFWEMTKDFCDKYSPELNCPKYEGDNGDDKNICEYA